VAWRRRTFKDAGAQATEYAGQPRRKRTLIWLGAHRLPAWVNSDHPDAGSGSWPMFAAGLLLLAVPLRPAARLLLVIRPPWW